MNIAEPLRTLGPVGADDLIAAVATLTGQDWRAQSMRQDEYEVHRQTESVVILFLDASAWPEIIVNREFGWDRISTWVVPVMNETIEQYYPAGGAILRSMLAKLPPGGIIAPHVDKHPSFHATHRIHVPVKTNPRVRFNIDGRPHQLHVGQAYELNNQKMHSVMNKGSEDRITLIFDYLPPSGGLG